MSASHDWIKSTLGHGETMCRNCSITNREAAALGCLDTCDTPAPTPIADSSEAGTDDPFAHSSVMPTFKDNDSNEVLHLECVIHKTIIGQDQKDLYARAKAICKKANAALSAPVVEPVAWRWRKDTGEVLSEWIDNASSDWRTATPRQFLLNGNFFSDGVHIEKSYTHPPAPAVGAEDVARALAADLLKKNGNHGCLIPNSAQLDSFIIRGHVDLTSLADAALALLSVKAGGVQGSIDTKPSSDPEGSSRTEAAGGDT